MPIVFKKPLRADPVVTTFESHLKWMIQKEDGVEVDRRSAVSRHRARTFVSLLNHWTAIGTLPKAE